MAAYDSVGFFEEFVGCLWGWLFADGGSAGEEGVECGREVCHGVSSCNSR